MFVQRHDARMRFPWQKADTEQQLDLLGDAPTPEMPAPASRTKARSSLPPVGGIPRMVPTSQIDEDSANPRTEFPDAKLNELADDIGQRGILEPLVVHAANEHGRYLLHFGAMRLRAAVRAGLHDGPVVIRNAPADRYASVIDAIAPCRSTGSSRIHSHPAVSLNRRSSPSTRCDLPSAYPKSTLARPASLLPRHHSPISFATSAVSSQR